MLGLVCLSAGKYFFISWTIIVSSSDILFLSSCSLNRKNTHRRNGDGGHSEVSVF